MRRSRTRTRGPTRPTWCATSHLGCSRRSPHAELDHAFKLAVERNDTRVEEWQDLCEHCAGHFLHRIEPEVAVQQPCPGDAAGTASVWTGELVDVEGQSPLVRLTGELIEAVGVLRVRRAHLVHIQLTDLVHHHHGNRFRSQDARSAQAATVEQRLDKLHVILRRAERTATTHEELGTLWHLEWSGCETSVRLALEEGRDAALLLAADQKARILHAKRLEDVLAEIDLE